MREKATTKRLLALYALIIEAFSPVGACASVANLACVFGEFWLWACRSELGYYFVCFNAEVDIHAASARIKQARADRRNQGGNPGRELHLAKWQTEKISEAADDDTEKVAFLWWGRHVCGALVWFEGVKVCAVSVCQIV